jgi:hypothetical protein
MATSTLAGESDDAQIIKNDTKPAEQLCAETDLSSFSRFTRGRCASSMSVSGGVPADQGQLR